MNDLHHEDAILACRRVLKTIETQLNWSVGGLDESTIRGIYDRLAAVANDIETMATDDIPE